LYSNIGWVVKQVDGNQVFQITENFILTPRTPANKSMWVDYICAVPSNDFTPDVIEESSIDLAAEFIASCGKSNLQMDASSSEFCRKISTLFISLRFIRHSEN
jgi:laminin, alpha 3/5